MAQSSARRPEPLGRVVLSAIRERLDQFLADSERARANALEEHRHLPPEIAAKLDSILGKPSYREATLTQLAWSLAAPAPIDITQRQPGGRTATAELKKVLEARHISARNAFENIGKNFPELRRGNEPDFDSFLNWANAAGAHHRRSAFDYLLARVSLTARPVAAMPELNRPRLTFARVAGLFQSMLEVPSGGVHHQFMVAACLHAIIEEFELGGPGGLRAMQMRVTCPVHSREGCLKVMVPSVKQITVATRLTARCLCRRFDSLWRGACVDGAAAVSGPPTALSRQIKSSARPGELVGAGSRSKALAGEACRANG